MIEFIHNISCPIKRETETGFGIVKRQMVLNFRKVTHNMKGRK
jgi:hypothetical protein